MRQKIEDRRFHQELKTSHDVVVKVAACLTANGLPSQVKTMRVTPNHARRREYQDDGDITTPKGRVEVKYWPNIHFTCQLDMPYPMVFVDEVYQIDRPHAEKLAGYVICNSRLSHLAIISASTRRHWRKVTKFDKRYSTTLQWYACPRRLLKYRAFS